MQKWYCHHGIHCLQLPVYQNWIRFRGLAQNRILICWSNWQLTDEPPEMDFTCAQTLILAHRFRYPMNRVDATDASQKKRIAFLFTYKPVAMVLEYSGKPIQLNFAENIISKIYCWLIQFLFFFSHSLRFVVNWNWCMLVYWARPQVCSPSKQSESNSGNKSFGNA